MDLKKSKEQIKKFIVKNKKQVIPIVCTVLVFCAITAVIVGVNINKDTENAEEKVASVKVMCTVTDMKNDYILVVPATNSNELDIANRYKIGITRDIKRVKIGSVLDVEYSGEIKEIYPAEFETIINMKIVHEVSEGSVEVLNNRLSEEEKETLGYDTNNESETSATPKKEE